MAKPFGAICNLDCSYCYYLGKKEMYPASESFRMSDEVLEQYIRQYIDSQDTEEITFVWQGGEPTLLGLGFFEKALALQDDTATDAKSPTRSRPTEPISPTSGASFFTGTVFSSA